MKRTIKFRAQRLDNGKWVYGDLEHNPGNKITRIHTYDSKGDYQGQHIVIPESVCQFTGLLDRNGKEIYEGDILLCKGKHLYHVDWITDGFMIRGKAYGGVASIKVFLTNQREVTGNIYDNPELLK